MAEAEKVVKRVITERAKRKGRKTVEKNFSKLDRLEVTYVPLEELEPNDYNPNRQADHDFELLIMSMTEDGFTQPIVVNLDNIIVDGEHRWRAAQTVGLEEIPVVYVDMTYEQMRISTIRHNRARGDHDVELEAGVLKDLAVLGNMEWIADSLLIDEASLTTLIDDMDVITDDQVEQAVLPDFFSDEDEALVREGPSFSIVTETEDGVEIADMSPEVVALQRKRRELVEMAKGHEEARQRLQEKDIFRVIMQYMYVEGELVKVSLGKKPAEKILQLCRMELEE